MEKYSTTSIFDFTNIVFAYRCPICGGNGLVAKGFYDQISGKWSVGLAEPFERCRSCDGTGIVWH
jgi:hypothetical protein